MLFIVLLTVAAGALGAAGAVLVLFNRVSQLDVGTINASSPQLEHLIDKRLNNLILNLQKQIPMAAAFLTGALAEKLKGQAKEEFMNALPEAGELLVGDLKKKMFESESWRIMKTKALIYAALAGAVVGLCCAAVQLLFIN